MAWLKKIESIILNHSSNIPYVVLEDGIYLCYDNSFDTCPSSNTHSIAFKVKRHELTKQSSYYYYHLKNFPYLVPFENLICLDGISTTADLIKEPIAASTHLERILLIKHPFLSSISEKKFQHIANSTDHANYTFLMAEDSLSEREQTLSSLSTDIFYDGSWYRTSVAMADRVCKLPNRLCCWTRDIPPLSVTCYGLKGTDDKASFEDTLTNIGIRDFEVIWN